MEEALPCVTVIKYRISFQINFPVADGMDLKGVLSLSVGSHVTADKQEINNIVTYSSQF
jgi:hypothetical protein